MGIFDRAWEIGESTVDRAWNTAGGLAEGFINIPLYAYDLAKVPLGQSEYDGLLDAFWNGGIDRAGNTAEQWFGRKRGLGAAISMVPGPIRRAPINTLDLLNTAYTETIDQSLSALMMASALADTDNSGQWSKLLEGKTWTKAWAMAETTSFGEAAILAISADNILDPKDVSRAQGSDYYAWAAFAIDFSTAMALDPLVIGGKGIRAAREIRQIKMGAEALQAPRRGTFAALAHREALYKEGIAAGRNTLRPGVTDRMRLAGYRKAADVLGRNPESFLARWSDAPTLTQRLGRKLYPNQVLSDFNRGSVAHQMEAAGTFKRFKDEVGFIERMAFRGSQPKNYHIADRERILGGAIASSYGRQRGASSLDTAKMSSLLARAYYRNNKIWNLTMRHFSGDTSATYELMVDVRHGIEKGAKMEELSYDLDTLEKFIEGGIDTSQMTFLRDRNYDDLLKDISLNTRYLTTTPDAKKQLGALVESEFVQEPAVGAAKKRGSYVYRPANLSERSIEQGGTWNQQAKRIVDAELMRHTREVGTLEGLTRSINENRHLLEDIANQDYHATAAFTRAPELTMRTKLGLRFRTSELYQHNNMVKPLRVIMNLVPGNVIDHSLTDSDVKFFRMLDQTPLSLQDKLYWRGLYNQQPDPLSKGEIFEIAMTEGFKQSGKEANVSQDAVLNLTNALDIRRRYNGTEFAKFAYDDGVGYIISRGVDETAVVAVLAKEQSVLSFMPDFRAVRKFMRRRATKESRFKGIWHLDENFSSYSEYKIRPDIMGKLENEGMVGGLIRSGSDGMANIMQLWSKSVLTRPAFTLRVPLGDEMVRRFAKWSSLFGHGVHRYGTRQGLRNWVWDAIDREYVIPRYLGYTHKELGRSSDVKAAVAGAVGGAIFSGGITSDDDDPLAMYALALVGGAANTALAKKMRVMRKVPVEMGIRPLGSIPAFENLTDDGDRMLRLNSSRQSSLAQSVFRQQSIDIEEAQQWGHFETIRPKTEADITRYGASWNLTANETLRHDGLGKYLMGRIIEMQEEALAAGNPGGVINKGIQDDAVKWLWSTEEGRVQRNLMKSRHRTQDDTRVWVDQAFKEVNEHFQYGGIIDEDNPHLFYDIDSMKRLLNGEEIDFEEFYAFNDGVLDQLPPINGASMRETLGAKKSLSRKTNDLLDKGLDLMARLPTDHMSRNREFATDYEMEMRRLLYIETKGQNSTSVVKLSRKKVASMRARAQNYALKETKDLLYDLSERSEFAEMTKFILPFFPAFQEVFTRYAALAVDNPVWAARMYELWGSPAKAPAIFYTDESTGEEYLRIPIPSFARGLAHHTLFGDAFDSQDEILLPVKSFNMLAQGPGVGPIAQIPLKEIVKDNPDLEETAGFIFPYGPPEDVIDTFLSAYQRRLVGFGKGMESEEFASAYNQIMITKWTQMLNGDYPKVDFNDPAARAAFLDEIMEETKSFAMMRSFASAFSPAAPRFSGPYRTHVDAYRALQDADPKTADKEFIDLYGDEFFPLTQSFTKSLAGIPPTLEGIEFEEKYGDLITKYPTYGGIITGPDAGGTLKFSRFAYDRQLKTPLYPGGSEKQRERYSPAELIQANRTALTWIKFSQAMDVIDAAMEERDLPNLRIKAAEPLRIAKNNIVQTLGEQNPEWLKEYYTRDPMMWQERIAAFTDFTRHEDLSQRPDIEGLTIYLRLRTQIRNIMDERGLRSLDSIEATPVREAWETAVQRLVNRNLQFADVYHRYLDTDPVVD